LPAGDFFPSLPDFCFSLSDPEPDPEPFFSPSEPERDRELFLEPDPELDEVEREPERERFRAGPSLSSLLAAEVDGFFGRLSSLSDEEDEEMMAFDTTRDFCALDSPSSSSGCFF
jgi:hypothetical protein